MTSDRKPSIGGLRWYIGGMLFLSTAINYIDRQTLSVLAPYIQRDYHWSNSDFALLIIAFRLAYTIGQSLSGRFLDRVGTRRGLATAVGFYSLSAMLTAAATGLRSFCTFRFLLGLGESANWPGATKAVSEWFPRRESGWAVAIFDSGSSVGAAVAPAIVLAAYAWFGSWRPVFVLTGLLGFLWLALFLLVYRQPEEHPRISAAERFLILSEREHTGAPRAGIAYRRILSLPQTWGIVIGKTMTDPVWFFITDWFAIYLVSRGYRLEDSLLAFWAPFVAADAGNFAAGGVSSWLIQRGWPVGRARKAVVLLSGLGMMLLGATVLQNSFGWMVGCFAASTFFYASISTMILNLPADVFPSHSVASVSGMSGTGAGLGTIAATYLTGVVADASSFEPVLIGASLMPLVAVAAVLSLVRNTRDTEAGIVRRI